MIGYNCFITLMPAPHAKSDNRCQFHQHFKRAFFIRKRFEQLFSNYVWLCNFLAPKFIRKNASVKHWWNWRRYIDLEACETLCNVFLPQASSLYFNTGRKLCKCLETSFVDNYKYIGGFGAPKNCPAIIDPCVSTH